LICGIDYNIYWLDALNGIIGSVVITSWAISLIKNSGGELIDFKKKINAKTI